MFAHVTHIDDPYGGFNFEVTVHGISDDGKAVGGFFSEVSGLDVTIDTIEHRHGSKDITPREIPGLKKPTNITLKRGITRDLEFWNWIVEAMKGKVRRADGSVILLNADKQEVTRWYFKRGWPCKLMGPDLKANANEIAMESLEICHEGLEIDSDKDST